jgi:hypothetical protein
MVQAARAMGFLTFVSTVHMHLTLDPVDKAVGVLALLTRLFAEDPTVARCRYAFVGDSGNDDACFGGFVTTIGVANVAKSLGQISLAPRYVARAERGAGFAEIGDRILALRGAGDPAAPRVV